VTGETVVGENRKNFAIEADRCRGWGRPLGADDSYPRQGSSEARRENNRANRQRPGFGHEDILGH